MPRKERERRISRLQIPQTSEIVVIYRADTIERQRKDLSRSGDLVKRYFAPQ